MKPSRPQRPSPRDVQSADERTRFAVDAMHGSLARKLRAIGYDASYYRQGGDAGIIQMATREGRVIVTSDRTLFSRASSKRIPAVLLKGKSDGVRLGEIARSMGAMRMELVRGDSLCSICGGELRSLKRPDVTGLVPPSVERRHRMFYRCVSCGQIYWRGGHWKKLRSLARRLETK